LHKRLIIIKDPEVAKLFADETRRQILQTLRHHEHSTTQLAKALGKSHSSIIHHLNLLKEAGLVEETRTEKVRNMVVSYYRNTARRFMISYSLGEILDKEGQEIPWQEGNIQYLLDGLSAFDIHVAEAEVETVRKLLNTYFLRDQKAFEEALDQQREDAELRSFQRFRVINLLKRLKLSEDQEYIGILGELRELLMPDANERSEY
jgi:DNA-binding transcriptional ArsR family regulator